MKIKSTPVWSHLQKEPPRRFSGVAVSGEHRLAWGWMRLVLGLMQMAFAVTAAYLIISGGFHWRALVAGSVAGVAAGASRYFFAGQPDLRLDGDLRRESDGNPKAQRQGHAAPRGGR
jgi:hypothetical protein